MCGIFGYYDRQHVRMDDARLQAMGRLLRHRGPDDTGVRETDGVAIGNRRLSIIDIAGGHQPFVSDDGTIAIVQNGEIFNHVELAAELSGTPFECRTHSDTEVLLRLYERDGIDFLHRLNGMFAIAIHDARIDTLFLVRDRIGVKPLYIHDDGTRLCFASEIKSLLSAGVPRKMDPVALHHYLTFNYVPPPHTLFEGIRHLMPGHLARIDRKGCTESRWWSLADQEAETRTEGDWISAFNETLDDAVRLRLRSDVPFGAFLSGGVDSSTVVGMMSRHMTEPVNTYAIGFHEERFDESPYAARAAELFGTRHTLQKVDADMLDLWPLAVWHCDQPHGDVSFLPTYRVAQLAAREVKVVLTGDGGDELFAGYDKHRNFFSRPAAAEASDAEFRRAYHANLSLFDEAAKRTLYTATLSRQISDIDSRSVTGPLFDEARHMDRINQALYIDMQLLLSGNNLVKPDRMGMAVSLEARTPFLDYRMMELAFRMPGSLKLKDGETKYLYKKAVSPLIGHDLAYRRKQMFTVPVGEWFRDSLSGFVEEVLLGERTIGRGLFDPMRVRTLIDEHRSGKTDRTRELRALIAVELWARTFIDPTDFVDVADPDFQSLGLDLRAAPVARP
ncbi:asparagine synthase [Methyloversatilis sp. RAC08]|uniref:asparagine synthase (glutamine-hydrolyzing) n=1 Tax=Methyloversatilis sp. RAC08 TaxID=1842540 RepID=UPI0008560AA9|nr:asparagine synthase (glutamine-hydrolyzing) [Methyloversatilis sp. RAC08]AOF83528.1 asparagine synthase [Methyloversatilis sp. RAC08]